MGADDDLAPEIKFATGANENVVADEEARSGLVDAIELEINSGLELAVRA